MRQDDEQTRDIGAGYPEEEPPGANPGARKHGAGEGGQSAPGTKGDQDSSPGAATGNPGAAGADD